MFYLLLIGTFLIALLVSAFVARIFRKSILSILNRLLDPDIAVSWLRYLMFAIYVVGVSSGVHIWDLEKYLPRPGDEEFVPYMLTTERWVLEIYDTIINSLQGTAMMLLVFFIVALIGFVLLRFQEIRFSKKD